MPDFTKATIEWPEIKIYLHGRDGFMATFRSKNPDRDLTTIRETRRVFAIDDNRNQGWIAVHFL